MSTLEAMTSLVVRRTPDGVAWVEMARPQVSNAFDETMIAELDQAFAELGDDAGVRAIVLASQGKAFSAGADLQWMKRASEATQEWNIEDARRFASMLQRIEDCPKPTIAKVQGVALGGGMGLVCVCDIAIASDQAKFAASEARFGILPSVIGPYLVNAVGKRHAKKLGLMASRIDAEEALRIGLIHARVPLEALDDAVRATLAEILQNGPRSLAEIKQLYAQLPIAPVSDATRELTAQTIARVRMTDEAKEGFGAFLEKRPAAWISRGGSSAR